jgi:hypothetical protein
LVYTFEEFGYVLFLLFLRVLVWVLVLGLALDSFFLGGITHTLKN